MRYNGLLATALSFILVVGGSVQVLQTSLTEPAKQSCIQELDATLAIGLSPWLVIKCRK